MIGANLTGTGALNIRPTTASTTMGLAGGAGTLGLTAAELAFIQSGFSGITLGRNDGAGLMTVNAYAAWNAPLTLLNGSANISFAGSQTLSANNSLTVAPTSGTIQTTGAATLTTSGTGNITLSGPVALGAATAVTTGSAGAVNFGGTINGNFNLTGNTGTYSFASALGGTTPLSAVSLTSVNSLTLPSINAASILARTTGASADIIIPTGKVLTASGAGTPLTVAAAGDFINDSGNGALVANSGRWLVYSSDPANDTTGALNNAFRRFTCAYGGSCPTLGSGNGLLYTTTPLLTATPNALTSVTYGNAAPSLSGYAYTLTGYLDSDIETVTGSLTGSTTYTQGSDVGSFNVNYTSGTLSSPMGYGFTYANNASAITVVARTLTAALTGVVSRIYDATVDASLVSGNYTLSNIYSADDVTLNNSASGSYDTKSVGTGKTVSVSGLSLSGAKAGNYTLASTSINGAVGTIAAKQLTATVIADNKVYDRTTVAAGTVGSLIGVFGGDTVSFTGTDAYTFADKNVGTGKTVTAAGLSLTGSDASNYSLATLTGTADITAKNLTIFGVTASNKVYDRTLNASLNTAGDSLLGVIAGDTVTLDNSGASGSFADKNVGTGKAVVASGFSIAGADSANYSLDQPSSLTADITAKQLTATVTANNKEYDRMTTATGSTGALVGIIAGDTVTFTGTDSYSFADKNVGTGKVVTETGLSLAGADAGNYELGVLAGSADITAKAISISGVIASNKVYDRTTTASLNTAGENLVDVISGDAVTLSHAGASASFADKNIGTSKAVTATGFSISGADASNYELSQPSSLTADITAKQLTAAVTANNKVYDGTTAATGSIGSLVGIISGDTVSFTGTDTYSFADKNVGVAKVVTETGLSLAGADAANYALATLTGTANITAKGISITGVSAVDKIYDRAMLAGLNTADESLTGVFSGDTVTLDNTNAVASFADKNVGAGKTVTASGFSIFGADSANYALSQPSSLTADIPVKQLTATVTADNKVYDRTTAATGSTGPLIGIIMGDTVHFTGTDTYTFADRDAGTGKVVTESGLSLAGADAANYALATLTGTANITAKGISITGVSAVDKIYDRATTAALNTATEDLVGVISGDTVALSHAGASATFADKNVGTNKSVTASGFTISGADASNYALSQPSSLTADITAKQLTASVTGNNKIYDRTTAATGSISSLAGIISGDMVNLSGSATYSFADKNIGTGKTVTASGVSLAGGDAANYSLATLTGTADITVKNLSISGVIANDKVYDQTLFASLNTSGAGLGGIIVGDTVILSDVGTSGGFTDKNVGTAKGVTVIGFTISGADASNYSVSQPSSLTANITPKSVSAIVTADNKIYDRTTAATGSTGSLMGIILGDTVSFAGTDSYSFADKNVGTGKVVSVTGLSLTGADTGNYTLGALNGSADITAKTLAINGVVANSKVYDGNTSLLLDTSGAGLAGLVSGDAVVLSAFSSSGSFSDRNVGTGKNVNASGFAISGADSGNYALSQPSGLTANITPRQLTAAVTANNKVYDGGTVATGSTGSLTGIISGDTISFAGTDSYSFVDKNVGTGKVVTETGLSLVGADAGNYVLGTLTGSASITPKNLSISGVSADSKVYDRTLVANLTTAGSSLVGAVSGDAVTLNGASASGSFADINVGVGKAVTATGFNISGADSGNYTLTQPVALTASITPKSLTVTADNKTKGYGSSDPALTYTYNGLVSGDSAATFTGALSRAAGENAGTYIIGRNTLAAGGNYTISTFNNGVFTVNQSANLIVTVNNKSRIYGNANPVFDLSFSGLVNGDQSSIFVGYTLATSAQAGSDVGNYTISLTGGSAGNYDVTRINGTLTVTPALLLVTANNGSRFQGQANPAFSAGITGFKNGEDVSIVSGLTLSSPANASSAAGTYAIVPANAAVPNYNLSYANGSLTVEALTPAAVPTTVLHINVAPPVTFAATPAFTPSAPAPAPTPQPQSNGNSSPSTESNQAPAPSSSEEQPSSGDSNSSPDDEKDKKKKHVMRKVTTEQDYTGSIRQQTSELLPAISKWVRPVLHYLSNM
ncbi:MAG: YDG domain-containing protein [Pseudomonadota bacterium]